MNLTLAYYGVINLSAFPELGSVSMEVTCVPVQEDILSVNFPKNPAVILCDTLGSPEKDLEMAQVFRMNHPEAKIFLITRDSFAFDKGTLKKNGIDDAFLLPWEKAALLSRLESTSIHLRNPKLINYTPIYISDFEPNEVLDFDIFIFLPMNALLVPLARSGEMLCDNKREKARIHFQNVAYVHKSDMPAFREYYRRAAQKRGEDGISESEKLMEFETTCRELLSNLFVESVSVNTFTRSSQLMDELKRIVQNYVKGKSSRSVITSLTVLMNLPSGPYNHAIHVAIYAALFGMCLNYPRPYDLAMAGLLHDLGLSKMDEKLFTASPKEVSAEQKEEYLRHPEFTIELLQKRKLALSDETLRAILHHHVPFSSKATLAKEARLLAIADEFDYLTRQSSGEKSLSPVEALNQLIDENAANPGEMQLDLEMLKDIFSVLTRKEAA